MWQGLTGFGGGATGLANHAGIVEPTNPFITATGGSTSTSGTYKIHTFNSSSTFVVSNRGSGPTGAIEYLVVGGGGGGGKWSAGGGAGGGFLTNVPGASGGGGSDARAAYPFEGLSAPFTIPITVGEGCLLYTSPSPRDS